MKKSFENLTEFLWIRSGKNVIIYYIGLDKTKEETIFSGDLLFSHPLNFDHMLEIDSNLIALPYNHDVEDERVYLFSKQNELLHNEIIIVGLRGMHKIKRYQ